MNKNRKYDLNENCSLDTHTNRNQPKCNHSIYDYMQLVVIYD